MTSELTKFSVDFIDAAGLEAFIENGVPLLASGRNAETALSDVRKIG